MCILYCFKLHVYVHAFTCRYCRWHSIVPCLYSTLIGVFRSNDLVVSCMDGFKLDIFAYGQTGSEKTFTMEASGMFCMTSMKRLFIHIYIYGTVSSKIGLVGL